jgi:hypothetical protein
MPLLELVFDEPVVCSSLPAFGASQEKMRLAVKVDRIRVPADADADVGETAVAVHEFWRAN